MKHVVPVGVGELVAFAQKHVVQVGKVVALIVKNVGPVGKTCGVCWESCCISSNSETCGID